MELNTKSSFCSAWQQLLSEISAGKSPSAPGVDASGLMDHVDDCEVCLQASLTLDRQQIPALFDFLSHLAGEISKDDSSYLEKLVSDLTEQEKSIICAVNEILLPPLPEWIRSEYEQQKGDLSPMELFSALEAVALMANRVARDHATESIRLTSAGELCSGSETFVTGAALSAEVQEFAEVPAARAAWLSKWICKAAHFNSHLLLGLTATHCTDDYVLLKREPRKSVMTLGAGWKEGTQLENRPKFVSYA
jgi:hypothetical protein